MMDFGWGYMSGSSWIIMILFWSVIVLGVVYLLRTLNKKNGKSHTYSIREDDNAVIVARERYAKGEITREELNVILDDLK